LADFGHAGVMAFHDLNDQVGLGGFVIQEVVVVDFALAVPGASALAEEVHHVHGDGNVHWVKASLSTVVVGFGAAQPTTKDQ
jgi:hypothetical protein